MSEMQTEHQDSPKNRRGGHTRNARRRSRELALQGLYQYFLNPSEIGEIDAQIREAPGFDKADFDHYQALLIGSIHGMTALMQILEPKIDRAWHELSPVEKAVLVLGTLELRDCLDIPYRVVINEAVELTKTFGGTEAHRFVNGVLDKVALETRSAETGSGVA